MITQFEELILPITEFRKSMSLILDNLVSPKILMNRDKPKAVLVPYDTYKAMEEALENQMDDILIQVSKERLEDAEAKYLSHDEFWNDLGI